ncbi:unnamed protein product [Phaedon cochleariae]|uniref:Integrase catalytic domain-containing protein n=1 Tax=Phaedon cochleariae TaxID=80249 RepID=A0A9N9S7X3_PHACE|nr:unnamed protein product [Phaedon cochleariae]
MSENREDVRKSRRSNAGMHSKRDDNFLWESQQKEVTVPEEELVDDVPQLSSASKSLQEGVRMKAGNEDGVRSEITRGKSSRESDKTKYSNKKSSTSKVSSTKKLEIEKKRLALATEKAKAELMMKKQQLDNEMRILQLERDLAEAELDDADFSQCSEAREEIDIVSTNTEEKKVQVEKWIEKCEYPSNISQDDFNRQSDMDKLCNVIADAIKSVSSPQVKSIPHEVLSRQVFDKDFLFFDGKPEDWPMFKSQFERKVATCLYSDDEIMLKLQRCLKGEALEAVRSLLLHPGNVAFVIQTLEMRFGRSEFIIKSLINKIQNFPPVKDGDFSNIIKFSCNVNNLVATLETLEAGNHVENPSLLEQLVAKLPNGLKLTWGQVLVKQKGKANVKDFGLWVNEISSAACYVSSPTFSHSDHGRRYNNQSSDFKRHNSNERTNKLVLHTTENNHDNEKCLYCEKTDHSILSCPLMLKDSVDERWKKILALKVCFKCLKRGHSKMFCKSRKNCGIDSCRRPHHHLLHQIKPKLEIVPEKVEESSESSSEIKIQRVCLTEYNDSHVLLRIIPVRIFGPEKCFDTYALFDEGSTISLIETEVAEQLQLPGKNESFCMQWANDIVLHNEDSKSVELHISGMNDNSKIFRMANVKTVKNLSLPTQTVLMSDFSKHPHLRDLPIQEMIKAKPTILIGQDNINLTVARKVCQGPDEKDPIATKTNLGWVLHGNVDIGAINQTSFNFHICNCESELNSLIKESFSIDSFGVCVTNTRINSAERRAIQILEKTTKYIENEKRYETGLIWKFDDITLPESKLNAYSRLLCVERKMLRDKTYFEQYCNKINNYLEKGYIRKLSREEAAVENSRTWYLPHFGVVNPNKPKKFRLVFDAAARSHGTSLNENLLQGPDFLNFLPGVLMRFRRFEFAFCGDIAEMFHQVKIRADDRCSQRFLWRDGIQKNTADIYEMQVMIFGAACSPCSAQFVVNLNVKESKRFSHLARDVERNFYMDDYLDSCVSEENVCDKIQEISELHKEGGFNIVNWVSNSHMVSQKHGDKMLQKDLNKSALDRVLGIWWDTKFDNFTFKLVFHKVPEKIIAGMEIPTKRQVLKLVMSIFDPVGLLTCLIIKGRIILQQIWRCGITWDDAIPDSIHYDWLEWLKSLKNISSLTIPRCYSRSLPSAKLMEIHIFGDASEEAFAAVAYLRIVSENTIEVAFISAKARVSPLKPLSIPRLELQAAVMGTRLLRTILAEIDIPIAKSYLWSDSKTVLHWIRGDGKNYKQFIAHRVGEIQESTSLEQWRYVPSDKNVADTATRCRNYSIDENWFAGPDFLYQSESNWPTNDIFLNFKLDDENERKPSSNFVGIMRSSAAVLPDVTRFSKWRRFVRATAYIMRFVKKLIEKLRKNEITYSKELTVAEIEEAEKKCLEKSQIDSFQEEIIQLKNKERVDTISRIFQLSPFLDTDNLLKMHSRINNAQCLEESVRKPIILDPKNKITQLILRYYHEKSKHQGENQILNNIRQKYWIIKGRGAVKNTFKNCYYCRRRKATPDYPKMGEIPSMRLTPEVKPFTHTGIDYFGPMFVTVGRHREKRWGVLFTCLTMRAIHLEIAHTLTANSTIMALRRMISRRGPIKHLYSDNGTNFHGANEELLNFNRENNGAELMTELTEMDIEWHFIPPGTPHMGGCWERLIGSVKKILQVTLKEEAPKDEVLHTLFLEAESIVNSRPLTHVSIDPDDPDCLTPNHLLISSGTNNQTPFINTFEDQDLRAQWKKSQRLAEIFWSRWVKEYLPTLSKRGKWISDGKPIEIGDIVVIRDGNLPRKSWPLGKIEKIYPGRDNIIRVVDVKTKNGIFRRPVNKLCRFDVIERISQVDVDVFHKVAHEYENQDDDNESYFCQSLAKWNVLNLTEGYDAFRKEIQGQNYITLPQLLLSKDHIIEILLKHLRFKNALYIQPLLENIVAVARDLQKDFYPYFPQFLEILIDLLETKDAEQIEWTFTCLAYLFKFLWRPLVKDINTVFRALLPLLTENKPEYINSFAAESFAFVARKIKDKKTFLRLLLSLVKNEEDGISGCGKLLFQIIYGIEGQFHSCSDTMIPFLIESLSDQNLPQDVLFKVLEVVVMNILKHISPAKGELLWLTFINVLNDLNNKYKICKEDNFIRCIDNILKLVGQCTEYKKGHFLQNPVMLIEVMIALLNNCHETENIVLKISQISILILSLKNLKLSQEHASLLIRKLLSTTHESVFLYFVFNVKSCSYFEGTILPNFLRYCIKTELNNECFKVLTKLIMDKAPLCIDSINLPKWQKYLIDFKENNTIILNLLLKKMENDGGQFLNKYEDYYYSLICLPHLKLSLEATEKVTSSLETNIIFLLGQVQYDEENKCALKKILFFLNASIECFVHVHSDVKQLKCIFLNNIFDQILPLTSNPEYISSLKTLSLILYALRDENDIIKLSTLIKMNEVMEKNFSSPYREIRLLTSYIYTFFENIPDFDLSHSTDPDVPLEKWSIFSIIYNVESIVPHVHTYRDQLQNLEKLQYDMPQMKMGIQTPFKLIPLRYLCSVLYINFQLLWEPVMKIIASHAVNTEINEFWNIFGSELKEVCKNSKNPAEYAIVVLEGASHLLNEMFQESEKLNSKPDFLNYRILLWKALVQFSSVAEAKTRDTSELLLKFIESEYAIANSEVAPFQSIKQNTLTGKNEPNVTENNPDTKKKSSNKVYIQTLLQKLKVFSQFLSPLSMYREPELYKLYFDLLQHRDSNIQKAALDCIMTYKHKYLIPYKDSLYNLVDDQNFKHEITSFRVDQDSNIVLTEHREGLIPVVMQIVFSKMTVKSGLRTGGKSSGQMRRSLILRFLAGCQEQEMLNFLQKTLKLYNRFIKSDPVNIIKHIQENTDLELFFPLKRIQSTVNLLQVIFDQCGGLMGNDILTYLLNILIAIGALLKYAFDNIDQVHSGYLATLRTIRTSCIKIIGRYFEQFENYPWTKSQINGIFEVFVWPYLTKLYTEGIHSPTALLKLFKIWSSNSRNFPLLVKCRDSDNLHVLPHIVKLLLNEKCNFSVVDVVEEILQNLLTLEFDQSVQTYLPIDNLLPVQKEIRPNCKFTYGISILIPHVSIILDKIKRKLQTKTKSLNERELFILSGISEMVLEPEMSDKVLNLLLPVVRKKCNVSFPEDLTLKYIKTVHNLIRNVEKPEVHLEELSPLFAEIAYPSCRKLLCQSLHIIANNANEEKLKSAAEFISELNAFDQKWLDQPDFERRHKAFKKIHENIDAGDVSVPLGVLVIFNCCFFLDSEKDLSLKENSSHTLKQVSSELVKKNSRHMDYILNKTLFNVIRTGFKNSKEDIRNEYVSLLGHLARECPDSHFMLRDLNVYTNKNDIEVDFFENLVHLQIHRHARALLKFCQITRDQVTVLNPRTLMQFVMPLASHYLLKEKFSNKNSVVDAAIETIGLACRVLPWHQYEAVLKYYLSKLGSKLDYQRQLVRLLVAILDSFHFDLRKGSMNENDKEKTPVAVQEHIMSTEKEDEETHLEDIEIGDADENEEESEAEEEVGSDKGKQAISICEKVTILCKSAATRVIKTIESVLLPKLHKSLAQMTQYESSHKLNRRNTNFSQAEEDLLRVPISLAVVKLLQRLPNHILEHNLPGVFMKSCTFLKSHLESVRRVARETLQKIMVTLGPKYLGLLLNEMASLLNRGFQVHVLVFTAHGVLHSLKDQYERTDLDKVLLTVLDMCKADLFGILSEEKEVAKIAVKVAEARHSKSYDTLHILSQYITERCLLDILLPFKQILDTSHSFKTVQKTQTALRFIAQGLVENSFVTTESLLKFAYGTASKSIPQLIPKEKKKPTENESEKLLIQKEDCFIIPKIPGNRKAYRTQNVKTSAETNAHLLVEFGLRLCHIMLKKDKLRGEEYTKFIDPFIMIFRNCLKSKHVKLSTITLQCLSWVLKYDLPSLRINIKIIVKDIFAILHKYASAGLSKGDNFDLVLSAFKVMAVLVRDVKYYTIDTNQLKILLLYVEQDIHDHDRQAIAFNLLKAIIARKVITPELNEVMEKIAELSITSELDHVRAQARSVFHQFFMEYPLGNSLEKHLGFYLSQMSYELKYGRDSSIEMIQTLINSFPLDVLKGQSGTLLITLGARLVNDDEPDCRKKIAECISSMLKKLPKADRNPLFDVIIIWMQDRNISHCRLGAQLCSIFVTVEKTDFENRLPRLEPLVLKQFGLDNTPGKLVKVQKADNRQDPEEYQRIKDHHLFQVLQLVLKICMHCPTFLKHKDVVENLAVHVQTLLNYPHDWVRLAAAQFIGYVLSTIDIDHLSKLLTSDQQNGGGYLYNDPVNAVKSLTLDLCDQLQPNGVKSELAEQVIKNLIFVAKVLQDIPLKTAEGENQLNILWLAKRMRKIVNTEIVEDASSTTLRTEVFKWIAGVGTALEIKNILPIIHHLLAPLVREMTSTEEKNAPLRQLAKEVSNLFKNKLGIEKYTSILSKQQQTLSVKRAERKRARTQLAVTDPESFAKKKIKRHEKKKESKKRKITQLKGTKRNFKKRKTVDLEDSSEIF